MRRTLLAFVVSAPILCAGAGADERAIRVTGDGAVSGWLDGQTVDLGVYHALLIGIDRYQHTGFAPPLRTPVADVKHLRELLIARYGFDARNVRMLIDAQGTRAGILGALASLRDAPLGPSDNLFIYFAGHGYEQPGTEDGFWIPADGSSDESTWVAVTEIRRIVGKMRAKHTLLVSDSCFSGTLTRSTVTLPANDRFLAEVARKDSYQVITSGGLEPVADGGRNGLSLFAYTLTSYLANQGKAYVTASQLYTDLAPLVANASDSQQTPEHGKIPGTFDQNGEFVFALVPHAGGAPVQPAALPKVSVPAPVPDSTSPANAANAVDGNAPSPPPMGIAGSAVKSVTDSSGSISVANLLKALVHKPGERFRDPLVSGGEGPEMIVVPAGTFVMGSSRGSPANRPEHRVSISTFAIGRYEVTFAEYQTFLVQSGAISEDMAEQLAAALPGTNPVENRVVWQGAESYADWLSAETGKRYRLPSEAEWEYVARAGSTTAYWWGDAVSRSHAMAHCEDCGASSGTRAPTDVGSFEPNAFGVYDTAGNVAEWVADCWHDSYAGAPVDGSAWTSGACESRIVRGGSFATPARWITSYERTKVTPVTPDSGTGIRIIREL